MASKFSSVRPSGSIILWQTAQLAMRFVRRQPLSFRVDDTGRWVRQHRAHVGGRQRDRCAEDRLTDELPALGGRPLFLVRVQRQEPGRGEKPRAQSIRRERHRGQRRRRQTRRRQAVQGGELLGDERVPGGQELEGARVSIEDDRLKHRRNLLHHRRLERGRVIGELRILRARRDDLELIELAGEVADGLATHGGAEQAIGLRQDRLLGLQPVLVGEIQQRRVRRRVRQEVRQPGGDLAARVLPEPTGAAGRGAPRSLR